MELVLVRHALPVRIDATPDGSPADPGLSELGQQQAQRVLEALKGDEITHLYASPARRAQETALPLVDKLGLPMTVAAGLAEFDRHETSYVPVEELRAAGGPRWEALLRGEVFAPAMGAHAFTRQVVAAVEAIAERHPGGRAVLFMHSGSINAYTGHVTGQARTLWFAPDYASVSRLGAARDGRRGVVSLNETGHVRDLLTR
jgi:broad specificity phosphatase PhoE